MKTLQRKILEELIGGSSEPVLVARVDRPDWPVELSNPAFSAISSDADVRRRPLAEVVEELIGRDLAMEVSESVRQAQDTTLPVEIRGRDYLLVLKPVAGDEDQRFCVVYWRGVTLASSSVNEAQQALLKAKKQIRDLSREDAVSGLLNGQAFLEILEHDWAVAIREKSRLALVAFSLDEFDQYVAVFGRHAAESCLRRVAQAIRRFLRRASDVAARVTEGNKDYLVVLSHSSSEEAVTEFAERIASSVHDLGLHHPRSSVDRFVTVGFKVVAKDEDQNDGSAADFLQDAIS